MIVNEWLVFHLPQSLFYGVSLKPLFLMISLAKIIKRILITFYCSLRSVIKIFFYFYSFNLCFPSSLDFQQWRLSSQICTWWNICNKEYTYESLSRLFFPLLFIEYFKSGKKKGGGLAKVWKSYCLKVSIVLPF